MVSIDIFPWFKHLPSDDYSCLFRALTSEYEKVIGSRAAWTEALMIDTLKSHKMVFIVWIS